MRGTLDNCLVLDLSRLLPGPYCSMILGDHGARVIAIEHKRFKEEYMSLTRSVNRNKEHMTLNLKTEKGREIFFALVKKADVVLEGFRPGVVDRLGVGYGAVRRINPKIIYCSITGYGQTSPLRNQVGHDINYLGHSGMLSVIRSEEGTPCVPGVQVADIVGGLNSAIGVLLALYAREKTGQGQYIDISMTDGLVAMLPIAASMLWRHGGEGFSSRGAALLYQRYACYNLFKTADGKYITLGALERRFWEAVCRYFNVLEYIPLQYSEERRNEILEFFRVKFLEKTRDEWMERFSNTDACLGGVLSVEEALTSENMKKRNMTIPSDPTEEGSETFLGIPVKLSMNPANVRTPSPRFGENTHTILSELEYSDDEIAQFELEEII